MLIIYSNTHTTILQGHEEFFEIRNEFFKDTQGIVLVYDASSREGFDDLDKWLAESAKYGANPKGINFTLEITITFNFLCSIKKKYPLFCAVIK